MSSYIHRSHNVTYVMYHIVCPIKYRRMAINEEVDRTLKEICLELEIRYEIYFKEIGTDKDHVHFLVQTVPSYSPSEVVKIIKGITGREIFKRCPEVKEYLWKGQFWTDGYFLSTVGKHTNEEAITEYVKNQGEKDNKYNQLYLDIE